MITLAALTKRYGETRAVDALDLTVFAGRITGFLGDGVQYGVAVAS